MDPAQDNPPGNDDVAQNTAGGSESTHHATPLDQTPSTPTIDNLVTTPEVSAQPTDAPAEIPTTQTPVQTTVPSVTEDPQSVIQAPPGAPTEKKSKKGLILLTVFLLIVFLLVAGLGSFAYAVAYEKIKLDKYPEWQKKISYFVIGLPFMPKTPKFLLAKSALAHQGVTKQSFDVSVAIDSNDLASSLGLSQIDLQAKGVLDYSDPKNLIITTEVSITKDFNLELRKKDKTLYFKINKLPTYLFAFLGLNSDQLTPVLDKWVSYNTSPLDTEARKQIQEDKEVDPLSEEFLDENFSKFFDEEVLSKMKLTETEENGIKLYKISVMADPELIDHVGKILEQEATKQRGAQLNRTLDTEAQKLSEIIKKLEWEIYMDKKDYYTRKIIISADAEFDNVNYTSLYLNPSTPSSQRQKMSIAFAAKSDNFGKEVAVDLPTSSMTFEEFTNVLSEIMNQVFSGALSPPPASN